MRIVRVLGTSANFCMSLSKVCKSKLAELIRDTDWQNELAELVGGRVGLVV